jgi:PEP-CTERM motif-containing protein
MFTRIASCVLVIAFAGIAEATVVDTTDPAEVAAFQAGATVNNFESVTGRTPQPISNYNSGVAVSPLAFVFDQLPGVQFSVGGMVGVNMPALYSLTGPIASDAKSPTTVLGPVDFDFTTKFNSSAMIEIFFFPTKVSKVGFWLNPSLGNVSLIAADTNFAFSKLNETTLETGTVTAGHFVGISRATADIGGFKIIGLAGTAGFTIDDFTYSGAATTPSVPEPGTVALIAGGVVALALRGRTWRARRK